MTIFIPISKIDSAKRLVYGRISQEVTDKSGEILDYASSKPAFQKWSDEQFKASGGKSKGNLRAMHDNIAAGIFTDITFDDETLSIEGCAKVVDDNEWKKCETGTYTGFSIGGGYAKRWTDPDNPSLKRYTPELAEVSLVDNPCVPTATFEFIKEDGSSELRKFNQHEVIMTDETKERPQDKGGVVQGFQANDGSFHLKNADALKRNEEIDAERIAAPAREVLKKIDDAIAEAADPAPAPETPVEDAAAENAESESADAALGKKEFTDKERKKLAESGAAMHDGSFPITDKKDLKDAIEAYGRAKDKSEAKAHIETRAKALGAEDMLPDDWKEEPKKAAPAGELKKGMYEVSNLAHLLSAIDCLVSNSTYEEAIEGDDSDMPEKLKEWLKSGGALLRDMVGEETAELAGEEEADEDEEDSVMEMAAALKGLAKKGATISAASKAHIDKMMKSASDHMDEMGKCYKALGMQDEDAEKSAKGSPESVSKLTAQNDALIKVLGEMTPKLEAVLKTVEALGKDKESLQDRIAHLEKQPLPAKGSLRVVEKSGNVSDGDADTKARELLKGMAPEEVNMLLMKAALSNPRNITK